MYVSTADWTIPAIFNVEPLRLSYRAADLYMLSVSPFLLSLFPINTKMSNSPRTAAQLLHAPTHSGDLTCSVSQFFFLRGASMGNNVANRNSARWCQVWSHVITLQTSWCRPQLGNNHTCPRYIDSSLRTCICWYVIRSVVDAFFPPRPRYDWHPFHWYAIGLPGMAMSAFQYGISSKPTRERLHCDREQQKWDLGTEKWVEELKDNPGSAADWHEYYRRWRSFEDAKSNTEILRTAAMLVDLWVPFGAYGMVDRS